MTGWIFQKTRWLHFTTMSLTAFSWVVLGFFYGFGYCFLTDWHWEIRREMGEPVQFYSYIQFLVHEMTGYAPDRQLTDIVTAAVAIFCYTACIVLLIRDWLKSRQAAGASQEDSF